ncbi:alpha/beta hydrolase [Prosthecobacter vanneervenii]|uniref:Alpha-beta hydrolase superfamily lysophospholipase n=1 Tax=Prosthecobacter vanneervenii TaxID=48466 RepID=A0A7W8DLL4_9BACT|nr:alpha/beta fold hydrolase [Prosthecobacter vanneervenii]MBB5034428.1 alpha-beta hydrolase superfamily lysophospholipase [Prosthecobacter vanneervenii]
MAQKKIKLPDVGNILGNVVLVHGRRGRKEDYLLIAERFCAVGFRCLLFDLPAHGDSPSDMACYGVREGHLPATVLNEAAAEFGFAPQPAGIMGISTGGAVSIRSASAPDAPWKAAIFVSTFDTLNHVVRHQASQLAGEWLGTVWSRITGWFYQQKTRVNMGDINSMALVPALRCSVMVAHGTADRVVPAECGRRLYAALPPEIDKRWVEIPGADHDNVLITDFPIYAEMAEWLLRHVPAS